MIYLKLNFIDMSYRYMRILVMFDLPIQTVDDRREYSKFRKHLIKNGFLMLQESVYCKITLNSGMTEAIIDNIRKNKPNAGLVQVLKITEKQYSRMECIVGKSESDVINSDERLIIL